MTRWQNKPALRQVYHGFHQLIAAHLRRDVPGPIIEIGAGLGLIKSVIPDCICTDLHPNPWIERVENAYALSCANDSVSNLILFDVWHHLEFPGSALKEFHRVLATNGRLIIFDPALSWLGWLVYGVFHHEPLGWRQPITWWHADTSPDQKATVSLARQAAIAPLAGAARRVDYSAQANATRVFCTPRFEPLLQDWTRIVTQRLAAISYVASGGYRGPQLYPTGLLPWMRRLDRLADQLPALFATRLLVVLEKSESRQPPA
jgi:SAM-dependent methyltransferase